MFIGAIQPFGVSSQNSFSTFHGLAPAVNQAYPKGPSVGVYLLQSSSANVGPGSHLVSLSSHGAGVSVSVIL